MTIAIIKRLALIAAIFIPLVLIGRADTPGLALFTVGLFLAFIPTFVLLALTVIVTALGIIVFRQRKLILFTLLALVTSQATILTLWIKGWTAASAFSKHFGEIGHPVLDPQLERRLLVVFWLLGAFLFAIVVEHLWNSFLSAGPNPRGKNFYRSVIGVLLFEGFLLLSMHSSLVNYKRMAPNVNIPASVSSDGTKEIQLVPMNAWIDTNGLVIVRKPKSLVWRTAGRVGDLLTESDGGRFAWSNDASKAYLLLNIHDEKDFPILGYDFKESKNIDPKSYFEKTH